MSEEKNKQKLEIIPQQKKLKKIKTLKIILIILAIYFLKSCFFFTGPIWGTVIDAKTKKPLANIEVKQKISGNIAGIDPAGGGKSLFFEKKTHTDKNGKYFFLSPISFKFPFISSINERKLIINKSAVIGSSKIITKRIFLEGGYSYAEAPVQGYESFEYEISWFPFINYKFKLLSYNGEVSADDCEGLVDFEKLRCLHQVASIYSIDEFSAIEVFSGIKKTREDDNLLLSLSLQKYGDFLYNKFKNESFQCCEKDNKNDQILESFFSNFLPEIYNPCTNQEYCDIIEASEKNDVSLCDMFPVISKGLPNSGATYNLSVDDKYKIECKLFLALDKQDNTFCENIKTTSSIPSGDSLYLSQACLDIIGKLEPLNKKVTPLASAVNDIKTCEQYNDALFYKCSENYINTITKGPDNYCFRHIFNTIMSLYQKPYVVKYSDGSLYSEDPVCNKYNDF